MVSFSCEGCGDVLTKKKLGGHYNQCWAPVTCLDCMTTFPNGSFQSHTSCISEAQKYQGHLYRDKDNNKKSKGEKRKSMNGHTLQAMVPRRAYVEDEMEGDDMNAMAVVDVPPRAPTPPPAPEPVGELPQDVNVFDFLVSEATPKAAQLGAPDERRMLEHSTPYAQDSQYSLYSNGNGSQFVEHGYSYGNAPIPPGMDRFDSWHNLTESQQSFVTPANKDARKEKKDKRGTEKSDKKRKRNVEDLDLSSVKRPVSRDQTMLDAPSTGGRMLHSGLTGGLGRLVTDAEFYEDRIPAGATPISPSKRSKREKDFEEPKDAKKDRRKSSYVSYSITKAPSGRDDRRHRSRSPDRERSHDKHDRADRHDKHRSSRRDDSFSSEDRSHVSRRSKAIEYPDRPGSVQPTANNQLISYKSRADLFMSFITKGPESERGVSINKALKRYHRERDVRGDEREDEDKELWKSLRLRRNSRGEIVLFF